jgi:hypothetical protein
MRWTVIKRVPEATSWRGRLGFASKSSWWSTQPGWLPPTLTWSSWLRGMDALPSLILPCRGRWRVANTRPSALDACEDISYLHTCSWIFTRSMWLFAGEPRPNMGGGHG